MKFTFKNTFHIHGRINVFIIAFSCFCHVHDVVWGILLHSHSEVASFESLLASAVLSQPRASGRGVSHHHWEKLLEKTTFNLKFVSPVHVCARVCVCAFCPFLSFSCCFFCSQSSLFLNIFLPLWWLALVCFSCALFWVEMWGWIGQWSAHNRVATIEPGFHNFCTSALTVLYIFQLF